MTVLSEIVARLNLNSIGTSDQEIINELNEKIGLGCGGSLHRKDHEFNFYRCWTGGKIEAYKNSTDEVIRITKSDIVNYVKHCKKQVENLQYTLFN